MNNYNEVKKSFGTQAEKFASYHMSKAEYTDYLIRSIQAKGNEHALEVAAGTCICGRAVAPYVKDITCLDLTEAMLEQGKKLAKQEGIQNISFVSGKTRCEQGHYVCNECHTKGMDVIIDICLSETSKNPIEIIRRMMAQPFCHMHGPEHHVMVGSALLTAYKNAGGEIDLPEALLEMMNRGKAVPGGVCGFWGACGAGISTGMFISIISGATPLKNEPWGLANKMTSKALDAIGSIGGPRCCKRDSYMAIISAIDYVAENFNIQMEKPVIKCIHSDKNNQCIKERCPFHE